MTIRIRIRILLTPMLFGEKSKSINFLNSNSYSNFADTHVIWGEKQKYKFSQFEFEFEICWHPRYFRKKQKFKFSQSEFEFEFRWHRSYFWKKGKV